MDERDWLADRFEENRKHLRSVAYQMLGSVAEADDAVQESWLRLSRAGGENVDNLGGWLTTVVARICLDMLRSRSSRREDALDSHLPDMIVTSADQGDPEREAVLADSVGVALLVVLETLAPAERLAFVLHDVFAVPFEEIAPIVGRSANASKMLASRARRRVQGTTPRSDADLPRQREMANAFLVAARNGDFEALVALLDPDVVLRADYGATSRLIRGARSVVEGALNFKRLAPFVRPVMVNGSPGFITVVNGKTVSVAGFTFGEGKIVEIDILADLRRLQELDLSFLEE